MFDRVSQQLEKYMDLVSTRQKLVAANLANVDTPGYRTKDIAFQLEFQTLAEGENPRVVEVPDLKVKNDGNDVSVEREARMLAENNLRFTFAQSMLRDRIRLIRSAIEESSK
jgi:flagellar basal-body rod protein FlgB